MRKTEPVSALEKSGGWTSDGLAAPATSNVSVSGSPAVHTRASSDALTVRLDAIAPHHDAGRPSAGGSATVSVNGAVRNTTLEKTGTSTARLNWSRPRLTLVIRGTSTVTGGSRTFPGAAARHGATAAVKRHPLSVSRATVNGKSWRLGPKWLKGSMSNGSSIAEKMLSVT